MRTTVITPLCKYSHLLSLAKVQCSMSSTGLTIFPAKIETTTFRRSESITTLAISQTNLSISSPHVCMHDCNSLPRIPLPSPSKTPRPTWRTTRK